MSGRHRSLGGLVDLPCRTHGGIGDAAGCAQCLQDDSIARLTKITGHDAPPPGETGIELMGPTAYDALRGAFNRIDAEMEPPRMAIKGVKDIDVRKVGSWVLVTVKFQGTKEGNEVTFRIRRTWADVLRNRLSAVLDR